MMFSMTGFGRGEFSDGEVQAVAEVRSVNNRFLDIMIRLPRAISEYEHEVKELVRARISRGRINVFVTIQSAQQNGASYQLDIQAARTYKKMLSDLNQVLGINEDVKLEHILNFSDIFVNDPESEMSTKYWECSKQAVIRGVEKMNEMRQLEGKNLSRDLLGRIDDIEKHLAKIEEVSKDNVPREFNGLKKRVSQIKSGIDINPDRLEAEIALIADRLDVTEECVRFRSHLELFRDLANGREQVGRRLNFLLQEMNREANTISSKANNSEISHRVVFIKEEVERLREQIQNIE